MTEEKTTTKTLKLDDSVIHIVRELLQLSLYTQTNIIDHLRAVRVQETDGAVSLTEDYVNSYNSMVEELTAKAQALAEEAQSKIATD